MAEVLNLQFLINNNMKYVLFIFMIVSLSACKGEFDYAPFENVEGKLFKIVDFSIQEISTSKKETIELGTEAVLSFSNCDSKKDVPCFGVMVLNDEVFTFKYGVSYNGPGVYIDNLTLTGKSKSYPSELPSIILTGDYKVVKDSKNEVTLIGNLGFKKNYPSIYGSHTATIKLKREKRPY
jgi:hypothetical protein